MRLPEKKKFFSKLLSPVFLDMAGYYVVSAKVKVEKYDKNWISIMGELLN